MSDVSVLVRRNVEYANHLSRVLSTRDTETDWPLVDWVCGCFDSDCVEGDCFSTCIIRVHLESTGVRTLDLSSGAAIENRLKMTTWAPVQHLDRIVYQGVIYEVETEPHIEYYKGYYQYRTATLVRKS